ncbi:MAG: hypothetical protein U5L00_07240 [Desulfovermiculus sp.]|nr:hypothetical protein [Desulfovermiculus sp.]
MSTHLMSKNIAYLRSNFKGREDIVPKFWCSKDKKRSGYSPLCYLEWTRNCEKPCRTCPNPDYIPLSDYLVFLHLRGATLLGVYPLLPDNTCHFIAADFDNHDGLSEPFRDIQEFAAVCAYQDLSSYICKSKSGQGYHAYLFFQEPVPAAKARAVMFALLKEAVIIGKEVHLSSFDKLFPNQSSVTQRGFGNLIALPFHGKAAKQGNTIFLDPGKQLKEPYMDQYEVLANITKISAHQLDHIIQEWELELDVGGQKTMKNTDTDIDRIIVCDFLRWAYEHPAEVKEPLWMALLSNVSALRPGGYELCHQVSEGYPNYSRTETDAKIQHVMNTTRPHTCRFIKENGFVCNRQCNVTSPIVLVNQNK